MPHIVLLLVLAAVPVWLHHVGLYSVDDCADARALLEPEGEPPSQGRAADRYSENWGEGNWVRGSVSLPSGDGTVEYVIVRTFDPKVVYHMPESRVLATKAAARRLEVVQDGEHSLPLFHVVARDRNASTRKLTLGAYLLVYNGEPVSNPYWAQLVSAPIQLLRGRRPMWLFFAFSEVRRSRRGEAEEAMNRWLLHSWSRYGSLCRGE